MSDLKKYVKKRKANDATFAEGYESGYSDFKLGVMLRQARENAGFTQEELAKKLNKKVSNRTFLVFKGLEAYFLEGDVEV